MMFIDVIVWNPRILQFMGLDSELACVALTMCDPNVDIGRGVNLYDLC